MDRVLKELEEAKEELEKLREECLIQRELSGSLKKAHIDQQFQLQEAKTQIEKQAKELNGKAEEVTEATRLYEEFKSRFQEVESKLKQANSVNETFRRDCGEKVGKLESENRKLVLALDEANIQVVNLEGMVVACDKEMEVLKGLLSDAQRKALEAEQKVKAAKELRHRDDIIGKLEEQSMSLQDQLKWKKEQFEHLEEAHKWLQSQFKSSKEAWESEKSKMLEEISFLQESLDTQARKSESLENQLKICNQALAHEETRRKLLELQLSESKASLDIVMAECLEVKSKVEIITAGTAEEIALLRSSMGMKDNEMKEMEYRITHLQQENQELLESVKELQEAQITKKKADPSVAKLKNKLKDLEEAHSACPLTLKEKEDEWNNKLETAMEVTKSYMSELKRRNEEIHRLHGELESCQSLLESSGEESSMVLMVLKSEFAEAWSQFLISDNRQKSCSENREQKITFPGERLENVAAESSAQELESFNILKVQAVALEDELENSQKKLKESSLCQVQLREQITLMEAALEDASSALDRSISELNAMKCKARQAEAELQMWKSTAETMRTHLEEHQETCRQMETSLVCWFEMEKCLRQENENLLKKLEDQSGELNRLQQQVTLLDNKLIEKEDAVKKLKAAEEMNEEKCSQFTGTVKHLQEQMTSLEQESHRREAAAVSLARLEVEKMLQLEKEKHQLIAESKDQKIGELQTLAHSWEQHLVNIEISSFSETVEKFVEINALREALVRAEDLMHQETDEKNWVVGELEKEVRSLKAKLVHQVKLLIEAEYNAREQHTLLQNSLLDLEEMKEAHDEERATLKKMVEELKLEKGALLDNVNALSLGRQILLECLEEACGRLGEFCEGDVKLMGMLIPMYQNQIDDFDLKPGALKGEKFRDHAQELGKVTCFTNEGRRSIDGRLPLQELN